MSATLTLFPVLGRTPPPWRWPAARLATSLGTHVAYVAAVALVYDGIRRGRDRPGADVHTDGMTRALGRTLTIAPRCHFANSPRGLTR